MGIVLIFVWKIAAKDFGIIPEYYGIEKGAVAGDFGRYSGPDGERPLWEEG